MNNNCNNTKHILSNDYNKYYELLKYIKQKGHSTPNCYKFNNLTDKLKKYDDNNEELEEKYNSVFSDNEIYISALLEKFDIAIYNQEKIIKKINKNIEKMDNLYEEINKFSNEGDKIEKIQEMEKLYQELNEKYIKPAELDNLLNKEELIKINKKNKEQAERLKKLKAENVRPNGELDTSGEGVEHQNNDYELLSLSNRTHDSQDRLLGNSSRSSRYGPISSKASSSKASSSKWTTFSDNSINSFSGGGSGKKKTKKSKKEKSKKDKSRKDKKKIKNIIIK